jgi:hypothetical protein
MKAARKGYAEVVKLLMEKGGDKNMQDNVSVKEFTILRCSLQIQFTVSGRTAHLTVGTALLAVGRQVCP